MVFQSRGLADNMPLPRTRILLILVALLVLALPAVAGAAPSRKKAIWGPATVNGRSQFPIYRDLGVGIWQNRINWSKVAPTRPRTRATRSTRPTAGRRSSTTPSRRPGGSASGRRSS